MLSSDDLLAAERPPRSIVILGAGAVGVEFASCYADYGCDVTLVEMAPRVLPLEDRDVSAGLARLMSARGIAIHTGATALPESVTAAEGGVHLTVRAGDRDQDLSAEALLVAIGRAPLTEGLGLDVAGVKLDRGFIAVDERMRTSAPGIYAVGDVNGGLLLAHVAAAEGALAADTIAGVPSLPLPYGRLPRATYCRPQVASIGLTEVEARERGHAVATARAHLRVNGKALIAGEPDGFVKVVVDTATSDVLGVHILGAGATELIAELALGQTLEAAVSELAATVHPHPTLSEAIGEAAHRALQRGGA
ncbi:MAG: FAD-dependent oxidoreductase [Dehalococcoidia bacterium]